MATPTNPLSMSDEEFAKLNGPEAIAAETPAVETPVVETPAVETPAAEKDTPTVETPVEKEIPEVETPVVETPAKDKDGKETTPVEQDKAATPAVPATPAAASAPVPAKDEKKEGDDKTPAPAAPEKAVTAPDYEAFYKQIMAPLKANGKTIELKSPEEAIQLMQMGANYTKKMQAITPYRKVLTMLENHNLLDENRLSFLIDLDKKDPEAIKKLIKEAGIDPLDIDQKKEPAYLEGNHRVSDEEVQFKTAVEELRSNPQGIATLQEINAWDQASKEVLWKNPELMEVIHVQRENGIYAQIHNEIERRRTLGTIAANTPFLQAYKIVGDDLNAAGAFRPAPAAVPTTPVTPAVTPVVTRVQQPKPQVVNNEKASAASPTRSTPRKTEKFVNPLSMSDDEFLAKMANRL